tara:strand:+ start:352 stop:516 length:165 start_codon:yes stop_codon:yes gene_type:complete
VVIAIDSHYDKNFKKNIYAYTVFQTFQKPTNGDQLVRKYVEVFFPDMPIDRTFW